MKLHKPIKFQEISYISDICFQTRQPVFVQLLSAGFRVSQCHFVTLSVDQRVNVENCIRTLSEVAKARAIAIPSDLDMKVSQNAFYLRDKFEILFLLHLCSNIQPYRFYVFRLPLCSTRLRWYPWKPENSGIQYQEEGPSNESFPLLVWVKMKDDIRCW